MDDNKNGSAMPRYAKIIVLALIVAAVAGVYLIKDAGSEPEDMEKTNEAEEVVQVSKSGFFDLNVTETIDLEMLKSFGLPIVIDFGADECIPCKEMAPVLQKLNEELQGEAIILFVDVWKYQELASDFPIRVIPTQVLIDSDGNPFVPSDSLGISLTMYTSGETDEHVFTTHEGGISEEELMEILGEMGLQE